MGGKRPGAHGTMGADFSTLHRSQCECQSMAGEAGLTPFACVQPKGSTRPTLKAAKLVSMPHTWPPGG